MAASRKKRQPVVRNWQDALKDFSAAEASNKAKQRQPRKFVTVTPELRGSATLVLSLKEIDSAAMTVIEQSRLRIHAMILARAILGETEE